MLVSFISLYTFYRATLILTPVIASQEKEAREARALVNLAKAPANLASQRDRRVPLPRDPRAPLPRDPRLLPRDPRAALSPIPIR